jgi:DNA primase
VGQPWVDAIRRGLPDALHAYLAELAVSPLPAATQKQLEGYVIGILNHLFELQINRRRSDRMAEMQRMDTNADPERYRQLHRELLDLDAQRRSLRRD